MSPFAALNAMHENDKTAFDAMMSNIASQIDHLENHASFKNIDFEDHVLMNNENKVFFGDRAIAEQYADGGISTHVQATVYFIIDKHGILLTDIESLTSAHIAVKEYMNAKYGGFNKII